MALKPLIALSAIAFGLLSVRASAQATQSSDVPDQKINDLFVGEKNNPLEKGSTQIVLTPSFAKGESDKQFDLSLRADYGLVNNVELGLTLPYRFVDPDGESSHQGIGDVEASIEFDISLSAITLSARSSFVLPTGNDDRDLGDGRFAWRPTIFASKTTDDWQIDVGVGGTFGDDGTIALTYAAAFAYEFKPFVGVIEMSGETGTSERPAELYAVPGAYWKLNDTIELGVGVPIGLTDNSDDYRIVGKLVVQL